MMNKFRTICWDTPGRESLFCKFEAGSDKLNIFSHLIIGQGHGVVIADCGQAKAVIAEPGQYDIATNEHPFTMLLRKALKPSVDDPGTGIWFFRNTDILNCRWGTISPIKYIDPHYKIPVGLGLYGNYSLRLIDPKLFFMHEVAGKGNYMICDVRLLLLSHINLFIADYLAQAKFSYVDVDLNRKEIAQAFQDATEQTFSFFGFKLIDFCIEGSSFDDYTLSRVVRIADLTAENQATKEAELDSSEMQKSDIQIEDQIEKNILAQNQTAMEDVIACRLKKIKEIFEAGLIDVDEYKSKKAELISQL